MPACPPSKSTTGSPRTPAATAATIPAAWAASPTRRPAATIPAEPGAGAPSAADLARQEETWSIATAQAEATAKAMGIGAGDTARAIREQVAPRLDWREVLRRYLSAAAKSDYAWTPPNRRYIARGLYLPSLRSESLGPVVIGVDTSGSIDAATLAAFAAEITAILDEAAPEAIHVVYCDEAVAGTETYEPGDVDPPHPAWRRRHRVPAGVRLDRRVGHPAGLRGLPDRPLRQRLRPGAGLPGAVGQHRGDRGAVRGGDRVSVRGGQKGRACISL